MFEELLPRIAPTETGQAAMRQMDLDKKWLLVYQDAYKHWKDAREKIIQRPVDPSSAPAIGASGRGTPQVIRTVEKSGKGWGKSESPQWYIQKFMHDNYNQAHVASLSVCLRTYELASVAPALFPCTSR